MALDLDQENRAGDDIRVEWRDAPPDRPPEHLLVAWLFAGPHLLERGALRVAVLVRRRWPWLARLVAAAARAVAGAARWTARTADVMGLAIAVAVHRGIGWTRWWVTARWPVHRRALRRRTAAAGLAASMAAVSVAQSSRRRWNRARSRSRVPKAAAITPEPASAFTLTEPDPVGASGARPRGPALVRLAAVAAGIGVAGAVALTTVLLLSRPVSAVTGAVAAWRTPPVALPPLAQRSVVYAGDGHLLAVLQDGQNRQAVPLAQISPALVDAVIDTEDARFWQHGGIDPHGIVRAVFTDATSAHGVQGGSTIAQQLVKNTYLTPSRSVARKLKEMILADRLERRYGKTVVLERYLNTVYFGEGAYGVEAAAETYFGVPASRVDAGQAALLAGLIQDPNGDDPILHRSAARARRSTVLDLMVTHHHLDPAAARAAEATPLPATVNKAPNGRDFFTDAVVQELLRDPRLGATQADRYRAVFAGGLQIHTTLDPRLQFIAQNTVSTHIPTGPMPLSAALASVDPATGAIRAVVGGPDFGASQYNTAMAAAGRQTGSAFKLFTLIAALEQGYSPNDVIDGSSPCTIPNPGGTPNPWRPGNFEGEAFGPLTLTDATAHSVNCAYARLALMVGLPNVARVAHDMGVTTKLSIVPSMTLGSNDIPPVQMASAYATLAAGGVAHPAHLISSVAGPDGHEIFGFHDQPRQVLSPQVAAEAIGVLEQVVLRGTGVNAGVPGHPVAGKTGTAENFQDAWFVGFTPQLATAVWMGDPYGEVPMLGVEGTDVQGGSFPARLWSAYMTGALAPLPAVPLPAIDPGSLPPGVFLQLGAPRGAGGAYGGTGAPGAGSSTGGTTWCWSSCGRAGPSGGGPAGGHHGHG